MNRSPTRTATRDWAPRGPGQLITDTAGANLAAITYYFGSKDDLIAEALFSRLEQLLDPVMTLLGGDMPAGTRLLHAVQALLAELERSGEEMPVYLHALMLSTEPGAIGDRGRTLVIDLRRRLEAVIAELVKTGAIASWVEPGSMAALLLAAAHGIALQSRIDPEATSVPDLSAQLAGLLLAAGERAVVQPAPTLMPPHPHRL